MVHNVNWNKKEYTCPRLRINCPPTLSRCVVRFHIFSLKTERCTLWTWLYPNKLTKHSKRWSGVAKTLRWLKFRIYGSRLVACLYPIKDRDMLRAYRLMDFIGYIVPKIYCHDLRLARGWTLHYARGCFYHLNITGDIARGRPSSRARSKLNPRETWRLRG